MKFWMWSNEYGDYAVSMAKPKWDDVSGHYEYPQVSAGFCKKGAAAFSRVMGVKFPKQDEEAVCIEMVRPAKSRVVKAKKGARARAK